MGESSGKVQMLIGLISRRLNFKMIACLTSIAFTVLTVTSCISFKVNQIAIESSDEHPSIEMKTYMKAPEEGHEDAVYGGVGTTLFFQQESGTYAPVASSRQGRWVLRNSPVGNYKIEIDPTAKIDGNIETFKGSLTETFTLKPGERAEIIIVLKKVPVGVIVLISVLIVGLIILLIVASRERPPKLSDLLVPRFPHLPGIPPPRGLIIPAMIFAPHGRLFLGPPPIFFDGGFYHHGSSSIETGPYYEPLPEAVQGQPPEYPAPPVPSSSAERFLVYPRQGQSEELQAKDRYECHNWAVSQTHYDPTQPAANMPVVRRNQLRADYHRAQEACLDSHGYTVRQR
jgi:hypothetical protein